MKSSDDDTRNDEHDDEHGPTPEPADTDHPVGDDQAADNRENESPS